MLPLERHRLIVELLGQHGVMRVNEIAQATRVSRETIRRDLSELERKGILTRSHGGALAAENPLPATRAAASALPGCSLWRASCRAQRCSRSIFSTGKRCSRSVQKPKTASPKSKRNPTRGKTPEWDFSCENSAIREGDIVACGERHFLRGNSLVCERHDPRDA